MLAAPLASAVSALLLPTAVPKVVILPVPSVLASTAVLSLPTAVAAVA
ncbi:hypothetical protein LAUMK35_01622 [Mycobacterium pseudokansasii]|nr:hypothetical protein LAUMK35_01622 [Mycobacterium pseudokansasii]VAZ92392.1 hypothetical protein LAUMK21_01621 [Mycobacterium pseudokansasii]